MNHAIKQSLDRVVARRSGATWRQHVLDGSRDATEPGVPLVWSRLWLRRRLRDPGAAGWETDAR